MTTQGTLKACPDSMVVGVKEGQPVQCGGEEEVAPDLPARVVGVEKGLPVQIVGAKESNLVQGIVSRSCGGRPNLQGILTGKKGPI